MDGTLTTVLLIRVIRENPVNRGTELLTYLLTYSCCCRRRRSSSPSAAGGVRWTGHATTVLLIRVIRENPANRGTELLTYLLTYSCCRRRRRSSSPSAAGGVRWTGHATTVLLIRVIRENPANRGTELLTYLLTYSCCRRRRRSSSPSASSLQLQGGLKTDASYLLF